MCLRSPSEVRAANATAAIPDPEGSLQKTREGAEISEEAWWIELKETLKMFQHPQLCRLSLLFWYTGFNQPYQLVTFGDRYFEPSTLGLMFALFYAAEVIGAWVTGKMLDSAQTSITSRAKSNLLYFLAITTIGNIVALYMEVATCTGPSESGSGCLEIVDDSPEVRHKNGWQNLLAGSVVMLAWGFSDSQVQAFSYWLIGVSYDDGQDKARAVGFYKFVQSAGWAVGFALSPTQRLPALVQLILTVVCNIIGTWLALCALPTDTAVDGSDYTTLSTESSPVTVTQAARVPSTDPQAWAHQD